MSACRSTLTVIGDNGAEAIIHCADVEGHLHRHSASAEGYVNLPGDRQAAEADPVSLLSLTWDDQ